MQPLASGATLAAYHKRLLGSHDFDVFYDVLDLDRNVLASLNVVDGQVNLGRDGYVRRSLAITVSDPLARSTITAPTTNGERLYADRMIRVRHVITVPGAGQITAVPFEGPVTNLAITPGEVQVTCKDKAWLASQGAVALKVPKGTNAVNAIRIILGQRAGETLFRFPTTTRRLSKDYSVGLTPETSPMAVSTAIARHELGLVLSYSCDGWAMLRPLPTQPCLHLGTVVDDLPSTALDFTTYANWVRVSGKVVTSKSGTSSSQAQTTVALATGSPLYPLRNGVPMIRPLIISEDAYTHTSQTSDRAVAELNKAARVADDLSASFVPVFHLDSDDLVLGVVEDGTTVQLRVGDGSIPLGASGAATFGFRRWIGRPAITRPKSRIIRRVIHKKRAKR